MENFLVIKVETPGYLKEWYDTDGVAWLYRDCNNSRLMNICKFKFKKQSQFHRELRRETRVVSEVNMIALQLNQNRKRKQKQKKQTIFTSRLLYIFRFVVTTLDC